MTACGWLDALPEDSFYPKMMHVVQTYGSMSQPLSDENSMLLPNACWSISRRTPYADGRRICEPPSTAAIAAVATRLRDGVGTDADLVVLELSGVH